jgi:hypothetical protein
LEEAGSIDELCGAVSQQREFVKSGDHVAVQDLMKRVQGLFFRVQTQEIQRTRLADALSKELQCEPRLSALLQAVPQEERALFQAAGERLKHSVFALKSEMTILSGLIEQNERFSSMLLSEWRRLDGGFMSSGGLDFRG